MKTALVLSGGGAGGAFQVGVLDYLWRERGKEITHIYGTSVGALNGAALRWADIDYLYNVWKQIQGIDDVMKLNWLSYLGLAKGKYSAKPLKKLIDAFMSSAPVNPEIKVFATVGQLSTGEVHYIPHWTQNFAEMVLASASVPFHMEPVGDFVDGGVRDHTPIRQAIADGAESVIVISCNPLSGRQRDAWKLKWPYNLGVGLRCTDILQAELYANDIGIFIDPLMSARVEALYPGVKFEVYAPDVRIIETFEYDPVKIRLAIEQGRRAYAQK